MAGVVDDQGRYDGEANKGKKQPESVQKGCGELGNHHHRLMREKLKTTKDGGHDHIFRLPDGSMLFTSYDGEHAHDLPADTADMTDDLSSEHSHVIQLPNGDKIRTEPGGRHAHEAGVDSTAYDGQHVHILKLPDGTVLTSLHGGTYWAEVLGKPEQANEVMEEKAWPYRLHGKKEGNLRVNLGQQVGKSEKSSGTTCNLNSEPYRRTITYQRRNKSSEGFPSLCGICKSSPVAAELFSDSWGEWIDSCMTCAENFVPKELETVDQGTDLDGWPSWGVLLSKSETSFNAETGEWNSYVDLLKADDEERLLTGIVLEPDEVDAQNDTITEKVIKGAAMDFLARYGGTDGTRLGLMHKQFGDVGLELVESFVTKGDTKIGGKKVKKGSWIMTVRVISDALWKRVKSGALTGFSIGGVAAVQEPEEES